MAKKARKRWLFIIGVIVLVVIGVAAFKPDKQEGISITADKVARRTITSTVVATGKIHPEIEVKISSEVAGEIVELAVVEGQKVKRGDLLVKVDPITLQSQVDRQEAAIETAKARAEQTRVRLERARKVYQDQLQLFENEFISQDQLNLSSTDLNELEAAYAASLSQIREQEMQLAEARETLAKATIYSPMDGVVTVLNSEVGERVVGTGQFEGTEIMRIANLDTMELQIEVSESDIVNVKIGNSAKIEIDAIPNEEFLGTTKEIAASALTENAGSQEQVTNFLVKVRIDTPDERLKPGMTATAEIETQTVENVLSVPIQSVTVRDRREVEGGGPPPAGEGGPRPGPAGRQGGRSRDNLKRVVFVVDGSVVKIREVETGIADNSYIEIKSGLQEGEEVVTGSYAAISRELKNDSKIVRGGGGPGGRPPMARK